MQEFAPILIGSPLLMPVPAPVVAERSLFHCEAAARKRRSWPYRLMLKSVGRFIAVVRYSAERFATWSNASKQQLFIPSGER